MVSLLSTGFVSCSDDDDDDKKDADSIVGTWKWEDDEYDDYEIITFRADGTGTWIIYDSFYEEMDTDSFTYQYDSGHHRLVMYFEDEVLTQAVYIDGDKMDLFGYIYYRVK